MPYQSIRIRNGEVMSLSDRGRRPAAAPSPASSPEPWLATEPRLIRAYLKLFVVPPGDDGSKIVSFARFGSYEVRLFEPPHDVAVETLPLWIELYAHDRQTTLDSCGCDELQTAVIAAEEFMAQARQFNEASERFHCLRV
jgi:hypothetical protein